MPKKAKTSQLFKLFNHYYLVFIIFLATVPRFVNITKASIWHDEGFTMMLVGRTPANIWLGSARDVHPPLYYLLLHYWTELFGRSVLSARSMSAVLSVITVIFGYKIVLKVSTRRAAHLAGVLLALAPFLIRYSQEARMYGVLGVFLVLGTWLILKIVEQPKNYWLWAGYILTMTAGLYTHYFALFAIMAHWLYLLTLQPIKEWKLGKSLWLSPVWWLANLAIVILYLPWLPNFMGQFTRGQGIGWIPKTTLYTFPSGIWQFFTYTDARALTAIIYFALPILVLVASVYILFGDKDKLHGKRLIVFYTLLPVLLTILVSIKKPIYQDRYLAFAAVGVYMICAMAIDKLSHQRRAIFYTFASVLIIVELIGIRNVYHQATHRVDVVATVVNNNYQAGDELLSAELYTYFDFIYYNQTGVQPQLYTPRRDDGSINHPNGYGESGLLYDRAEQIYVDDLTSFTSGRRVWFIGKTGDKAYYDQIPDSWRLLRKDVAGYSEVRLYQVQ